MNNVLYQTSHDEGRINAQGQYEYNINDHLGNLRVVFRDSSGIAVPTQSIFYDSWGLSMKSMQITRNPTNFNKHQFLNREIQIETGLVDLQNRQYDPQRGQFTSLDQLAELSRRFSPTVYGNNNSIRFIDPDGMKAKGYVSASGYYTEGSGSEQDDDAPKEDPEIKAQREGDKDKGKVSTGRGGGDNNTPYKVPEHLQASSLQNASISQTPSDNFTPDEKAAQVGVNIAGAVEGGYGLTKAVGLLKNGFNGLKALFSFSKSATNIIPEGNLANHLFKGANKLVDNLDNRILIQNISNSKALVVDQFGKSWYRGLDGTGKAIYSYTQNGVVKGAGYTNLSAAEIILKYSIK